MASHHEHMAILRKSHITHCCYVKLNMLCDSSTTTLSKMLCCFQGECQVIVVQIFSCYLPNDKSGECTRVLLNGDNSIHNIPYSTFCTLWRQLVPSIVLMKAM